MPKDKKYIIWFLGPKRRKELNLQPAQTGIGRVLRNHKRKARRGWLVRTFFFVI